MSGCYIGIDNGVSGSIAIIRDGTALFSPVPVKKEQNYTKAKGFITRIDVVALEVALRMWVGDERSNVRVFLERPMVNPTRFKATTSALRALEATLICLERLHFSLEYVDSKQWQKTLLPKDCSGPELKVASKDIGVRLFPELADAIRKHGDADSLLIAEWAKRGSR